MDFRLSKHGLSNLLIVVFLLMASLSFSQIGDPIWKCNVSIASMKPFFKNDQWFVTTEGYHIHPRTEDYTPGLSLGIERKVFNRIGLELNTIYGMPPATLGVIDEFSVSGRESLDTERFHFFAVLISPKLNMIQGQFGNIYIGPLVGYGILSEKTIAPSFGPEITWAKSSELVYGGRSGFQISLKNTNLQFQTEVQILSMKINLEEMLSGHTLIRTFGPLGVLLGVSYCFK